MEPLLLLLVEDEPDLRDALGEYLEACGFTVLQAGTAGEALRIAERRPPAAILTDLSLPDCPGDSFLESFHGQHPKCLLYVHSGDSSFVPSPLLQAMGLPPSHVFSKPADLALMAAQIQSALK
jgi:DNA-binding NtrC family response regulator